MFGRLWAVGPLGHPSRSGDHLGDGRRLSLGRLRRRRGPACQIPGSLPCYRTLSLLKYVTWSGGRDGSTHCPVRVGREAILSSRGFFTSGEVAPIDKNRAGRWWIRNAAGAGFADRMRGAVCAGSARNPVVVLPSGLITGKHTEQHQEKRRGKRSKFCHCLFLPPPGTRFTIAPFHQTSLIEPSPGKKLLDRDQNQDETRTTR